MGLCPSVGCVLCVLRVRACMAMGPSDPGALWLPSYKANSARPSRMLRNVFFFMFELRVAKNLRTAVVHVINHRMDGVNCLAPSALRHPYAADPAF